MRKCENGQQKINMSKYKNFLSLARGNIDISVDATHDTVRNNQFNRK